MIKMVISPEYFGNNDKKSDITAQLKRLGAYDINIDDVTGFVTAVMTLDNYEGFVESLKKRIEDNSERIKSKYAVIDDITYNPDYTVFRVQGGALKKVERKSIAFDMLMTSATYQVISGIPQNEASVRVYFYDRNGKLTDCIDTEEGAFV